MGGCPVKEAGPGKSDQYRLRYSQFRAYFHFYISFHFTVCWSNVTQIFILAPYICHLSLHIGTGQDHSSASQEATYFTLF